MYSAATDKEAPPPDTGKYLRLIIVAVIGIVIFLIVGNQAVSFSMNLTEFEEKFTKPLYYSTVSAVVLAAIALVRVNGAARSSIFWYAVTAAVGFLGRAQHDPIAKNVPSFAEYRLSGVQFAVWQVTKVLLFGAFFANIMFGFALMSTVNDGTDLGLESLPTLFSLPFTTPPTDPAYAAEKVIPMIPALLVLIPPVLGAIGLRLVLYVGVGSLVHMVTSYVRDYSEGKPRYLNYVSTLEAILGISALWAGFNMFFTDFIDYNTRYVIAATLLVGFALIGFSVVDKIRARVLTHMLQRDVLIRIGVILLIAIVAGSLVGVNNSIADAKKIEFLGPYRAQEIGVNRHLAELDRITEATHHVRLESVSPNNINTYVGQNSDVLDVIRVWDWDAAFAKLKPEIGLIPYIQFKDQDILRFNDTLYWTASMEPVLPSSVDVGDRWYNEHLVYTHAPNGFLTLEATGGQIVDSSEFFEQRLIYYGEGGLLAETWSAFPTDRTESAELNQAFYSGAGGLEVPPPLSWIFEPNFLLSFPAESVHIMRYKDVNQRMEALYPYFLYHMFGEDIDTFPVTDGQNTYWLVPLIVGFQAHDVPWSAGSPYLRLVGYAMVDTYDGDITLLKTGDDFFSEMFASQYADQFQEIPPWLAEQIRYPAELFNWKTDRYNTYHVTDVETFIQANEFYEIPVGLDTYYIEAKPPGFNRTEFVGLLSLELKGSQGRNLAGYMIVENDLSSLGDMKFYEVPLNSTTKLIGPTAVREALDRDPDFAQLKTLLRNPRVGDNILYRVGEHDTYFIPVYTAGAGGVVAQLGTIAAVGASFTGEYYVGLGDTQQDAFKAYLQKLSGVVAPSAAADGPGGPGGGVELQRDDRIDVITGTFAENGITVLEPAAIQIPLSFEEGSIIFYTGAETEETVALIDSFIDDFVQPRTDRVFLWEGEDNVINTGTIVVRDGIPQMHYISIEVGS